MRSFSALMLASVAAPALGASGCVLAAAGVVEASKDDSVSDPMGSEYLDPNGWVGWAHSYANAEAAMGNLLGGMGGLRCGVNNMPGRIDANCYGRPLIAAMQNGPVVYRLCQPGTDRMTCRSTWEDVHRYAPRRFEGQPRDD